jgi:two-component system, LytTR family, response regulator
MMRAFLVDDEPLALRRLSRMLEASGRVAIAGAASDPEEAVAQITVQNPDVLFLDIQMPGLDGFELLRRLDVQPVVIFTTAFDHYALRAFEVNSIDYLLKPIEPQQLERALSKAERLRAAPRSEMSALLAQLAAALRANASAFPDRIASRLGERTQFIELARVTHFLAEEKVTYAVTPSRRHIVDHSITALEQRLDPKRFIRIHRAILLNADYVEEVHQWFAGRAKVRLSDGKGTELSVARDRVRALRDRLGF